MAYSGVLIDSRTGVPMGELRNAHARSLRFVLRRAPTVTWSVDANHPFAPLFLTDDKVGVKFYDTSTGSQVLRYIGVCVGHQKTRQSGGGTVQVTSAGLRWRLDKRIIGKNDATGATYGTNPLTLKDRGEILAMTIDALNSGDASTVFADAADTGIRVPASRPISTGFSTYVGPWRYKPAGEVFDDVTGTLDSPEWEIVPIEPTKDALGVAMGNLNVVPAIGTVRPDVVFAFGTSPSNVESWTDTGDASTLANRAYNLPPGYPDNADVNATVVTWDDAASITDRGLYEAMVSADVQTKDLRQKLVQQHIAVRKVPRRIITFQPIAEDSSLAIEQRRVPRLFADYIVGDVIRFRAVEKFPVTDTSGTVIGTQDVPTVDLLMRVYAAQLDLDDNGVATTTLTLQEDN